MARGGGDKTAKCFMDRGVSKEESDRLELKILNERSELSYKYLTDAFNDLNYGLGRDEKLKKENIHELAARVAGMARVLGGYCRYLEDQQNQTKEVLNAALVRYHDVLPDDIKKNLTPDDEKDSFKLRWKERYNPSSYIERGPLKGAIRLGGKVSLLQEHIIKVLEREVDSLREKK